MKTKEAVTFLETIDPQSEEYRQVLAGLLSRIDPKRPFGTLLYLQIARLSMNVCVESVALRVNSKTKEAEVFMTQRDESDPDWRGYWHVPGTALRPGDVGDCDFKTRLEKEYGVPIIAMKRIGDTGFGYVKDGGEGRGPSISFVYLTILDGDPPLSERRSWFQVHDLPTPTVPSHDQKIIPIALKAANEKAERNERPLLKRKK